MGRTYRRVVGALLVGAVALILVAGALAARPRSGARYAGSGGLCQNNAPRHHFTRCGGRDGFSFLTSPDGRRVTNFAGHIGPLYCGGGTLTVTARFIGVGRGGAFAYTFRVPSTGVGGKVVGTDTAQIRGRFTGNGRTASVFYRLVTHFKGTSGSADCGAQVSGTAEAR